MGGHSLGGSITTAYATWDFEGQAGADGLAGLVFIDGGSGPTPVDRGGRQQVARRPRGGHPWLTFGGIAAPFTGLFNTSGALGADRAPNAPSLGQAFALLPANLKPPGAGHEPGPVRLRAGHRDLAPGLVAAQAHLGHLAASGDPRGWEQAGEITPIGRYARVFSGWGLKGLDGTAWYHPQRLTIDSGAVAAGNANPAQQVLDVHATHGARPAEEAAHLRVRRRPGRTAGAGRGQQPGRAVGHPGAQPGAGGPPQDLLAQRPELGQPQERLPQEPGAVPRQDRQGSHRSHPHR